MRFDLPLDPVVVTTRASPPPTAHDATTEGDLVRSVRCAVTQYFADLDGEAPVAIHAMLLHVVERPLLEEVLERAGGNQTRAAQWLGITRTTLRKKLVEHGLEIADK
jgi:Fis family transcriptional regulator, factor for inversion stimulation protein